MYVRYPVCAVYGRRERVRDSVEGRGDLGGGTETEWGD